MKWSGHGLPPRIINNLPFYGSTEDPRTWESSRLRRLLRKKVLDKKGRMLVYGILMNRKIS